MKKPEAKILLVQLVALSMFLATNLYAEPPKNKTETLKTLDEIQQMYADYNYIDDVYDTLKDVRRSISNATAQASTASQMNLSPDSKAYMAAGYSESLKGEVDNLVFIEAELNKKEITPRLQGVRKIINEMIQQVYAEYSNYKEGMWWLAARKDPQLVKNLITTGSASRDGITGTDEDMKKIMSNIQAMEKKFEELEEQLPKEQKALIEYHKQLVGKVKKFII
ncbi:MAG: hypothetical protein WCJ71_06425 [Candidatus Omnitrophota bacterium]